MTDPMTQSPPTGDLVARLRAFSSDKVVLPHIRVAVAEAMAAVESSASRITTLERELEEARAANEQLRGETYLASAEAAEFHRDNAITMWDAERKAHLASQAEVERLKDALKPFAFEGMSWRHGSRVQITVKLDDIYRARAALQVEESKG